MQGQSDSEAISALFISYEESWFKTNFTLSFGEKKGTSGGGDVTRDGYGMWLNFIMKILY